MTEKVKLYQYITPRTIGWSRVVTIAIHVSLCVLAYILDDIRIAIISLLVFFLPLSIFYFYLEYQEYRNLVAKLSESGILRPGEL